MNRLAAFHRQIRIGAFWLPSSLAWSLAIGVVFVLLFEVQP